MSLRMSRMDGEFSTISSIRFISCCGPRKRSPEYQGWK
jgi:hypothetical protein